MPVFIEEGYREGIMWMHELVRERLLDTSSFTQTNIQMRQIFENPDYALIGAATYGGPNVIADNVNSRRFRDYEIVPPLRGPRGVQYTWWQPYQYYQIPNAWVISSTSRYPEIAFRFADFMFSTEASMRSRLGVPGTDFIPNPPGRRAVDGDDALFEAVLIWGSQQRSHWQNHNPAYNFFANRIIASDDPFDLQDLLWNAMLRLRPFHPPIEHNLPPLIFTADEAREYNDIWTALTQYVDETRVRWITTGGIEREWDAYLRELNTIGLRRVTEITQAAYNRFIR